MGTVSSARRLLLLAALAAWPVGAEATPLQVRESTPAANATLQGDHVQFAIRFDGPVDHAASRLALMQSGHVVQSLRPLLDSAIDVLFAAGEMPSPGSYVLHWDAVSADGEVSRGDIPFTVGK